MNISLRPVTLEDGKLIVEWRNSKRVSSHCFDKRPITLESNKYFFEHFVKNGKYRQFIVDRMDEDFGAFSYPIATVYLKDFDEVNKRCELCIFTSNDQEWNTESQTIAIKKLLKISFEEYKMHKIYTYVFEKNLDEIELMKQAGFQVEAVLKDEAVNHSGDYVNVLRMAIFANI